MESRFFCFVERYGRYKDPKKSKAPISRVKKKKKNGFPFVCPCGSNTTLKFEIEILKIERGIAKMPFFQFLVAIT